MFVVAYLGDWRPPAAVLFERHSLCGNTTPSREKGKRVAGDVGEGAFSTSGAGYWRDGVGTMRGREQDSHENIVVHGTQDPCVSDKAFALGRNSGQENVVLPIHNKATRHKGGGCRQEDGVERNDGAGNGIGIGGPDDPCYTITSGDKHAVAFEPGILRREGGDSRVSEQCPTLRAQMGDNQPAVALGMQVRRLTPVECERLQGFTDNYTRIPWRGKDPESCPDGPRYKALGNSMAVPVMKWIGKRIQTINNLI